MPPTQQTLPILPTSQITAAQLNQFFKNLKQIEFNGQILLMSARGQKWFFYLHLGWIMYVTGGIHPVRRWKRNLAIYSPWLLSDILKQQIELPSTDPRSFTTCWEEHLLSSWVAQQKITREQAAEMTEAIVAEVLFDVAQAVPVTYQIKPDKLLSTQLVLID